MSERLRSVFETSRRHGKPLLISYVTAGFPSVAETVQAIKLLVENGSDIIELGIPFSDPSADGPTIQMSSERALANGVTVANVLDIASTVRRNLNLTVPIVLMGYYNPIYIYGEERFIADCKSCQVDGLIVVDYPLDHALEFSRLCHNSLVSYIPLVTLTSTEARIAKLVRHASGFIYVVSINGVTGARSGAQPDTAKLKSLVRAIRTHSDLPVALGFGVSTTAQFDSFAAIADGVIVGSAIVKILGKGAGWTDEIAKFIQALLANRDSTKFDGPKNLLHKRSDSAQQPNCTSDNTTGESDLGMFGEFGGRYCAETLVSCLDEIYLSFKAAVNDHTFRKEFESLYSFMGRPTPLHKAERLTAAVGGATIWLKREDLAHTGSHKINNAIGQVLLARRLGKRRIIAETGAGQHGVATATVCAKFGIECVVYMGAKDAKRQELNVFRMRLLGAQVVPVNVGSATLKDAVNEAMRDWVANVESSYYLIGSAIGPHPFPTVVREFQSVIGRECRRQFAELSGQLLPDAVVACVGGGSNAIGLFHPFCNDSTVALIGAEAAGEGLSTGRHSATLSLGHPGVLHGTKTYLLQDANGQIKESRSISAGLDYPGVGPEHAFLKQTGRATYMAATNEEAVDALQKLCKLEGILPALESAHAVSVALRVASQRPADQNVIVCISGRGDKDVNTLQKLLG